MAIHKVETKNWIRKFNEGCRPYGKGYLGNGITILSVSTNCNMEVKESIAKEGFIWWKAYNSSKRYRPIRITLIVDSQDKRILSYGNNNHFNFKKKYTVPPTLDNDTYFKEIEWTEKFEILSDGMETIISKNSLRSTSEVRSTFFCYRNVNINMIEQNEGEILTTNPDTKNSLISLKSTEGGSMDPISIISSIMSGLNLADKFINLVKKIKGLKSKNPSIEVKNEGEIIYININGKTQKRIPIKQLAYNEWDNVRYEALNKRLITNWNMYNRMYGDSADLSVDEKARIESKMDKIRQELCQDFHEMINIYQKTLGVSLEDYYSLNTICSAQS